MSRVLLKAMTCTCGKRSPRSLTDTSLPSAYGSRAQTSPLIVRAQTRTRGDSSRAKVTFFTEHHFVVTLWTASSLSAVSGYMLWELLTAQSLRATVREKSQKQPRLFIPPLVYFRAELTRLKPAVYVSALTPRACWDDACTDRNANNEHLKSPWACFRLDLWEPYGLLLVRLQLRWMAFLSILGDVLSFSVPLTLPYSTSVTFFHKSLLQTSHPPPPSPLPLPQKH